jgi:hypothetical protein
MYVCMYVCWHLCECTSGERVSDVASRIAPVPRVCLREYDDGLGRDGHGLADELLHQRTAVAEVVLLPVNHVRILKNGHEPMSRCYLN